MTLKDAYKTALAKFPDHEIVSGYVYESRFVFDIWPKGFKPTDLASAPPDSQISVDKKTGEAIVFQPFHMSIEEYKKGLRIF